MRTSLYPAAVIATLLLPLADVRANHPVLVEGNSDSPVVGTTLVTEAGTSGDFDGDGRIATAEDTDGADRIFGTLNAALGPGTGAAANTGANFNGTVTIVRDGRFAEIVTIVQPVDSAGGNVTLEAAPGVSAQLNAVLQGDANNNVRQIAVGLLIDVPANRVVTIRNLTIRNYATGILVQGASRVNIENCVLENNRDYGIRVAGDARVQVRNCRVIGTGFRSGSLGDTAGADTPAPGIGIEYARGTKGLVLQTSVSQSFGVGLKTSGGVMKSFFTQFDNKRGLE